MSLRNCHARHVTLLTVAHLLYTGVSVPLKAQGSVASSSASVAGALGVTLQKGGPDRPTLASVRECPRFKCEAAVELTVKGARLRVGDSTRVTPLYLTGAATSRYLSIVPTSRIEVQRGRTKLRQRLMIGAAAAAATVLVFAPGFRDPSGGSFPRRTAAAAVIVGTGVYLGGRRGRSAAPHFDEAVRLYNLELRP
jgi:hypothetical protein